MLLIGKPKIFIFQACRGNKVLLKNGKDEPNETFQIDSIKQPLRLPTDADLLKIYATTHGKYTSMLTIEK